MKVKLINRVLVILMLILIINLPLVSALEISGVTATNIAQNSATITWNTDTPADSFVSYGIDKTNLQKLGDAKAVKEHIIKLWGLNTSTTYNYYVESGEVKDDNSGSFYSFTTLAPDVTPPELVVEIPTAVKGDMLDVIGWTEVGASVKLLVDGELAGTAIAQSEAAAVEEVAVTEEATTESAAEVTADVSEVADTEVVETETSESETIVEETATEEPPEENIAGAAIVGKAASSGTKPEGKFVIPNIFLTKNAFSNLTVTATDGSGNSASESVLVWSDASKPVLNLSKIPELVSESTLEINGTISENASYEIIVNNKSVAKKEKTTVIKETVSLTEGKNTLQITAVDAAGWEASETYELVADSQPPTVTFEIVKGNEYYQGRADSDVKGKTEPGANVYIYVYRPIGYEFNPDFSSAWAKVTADENGEFTFEDINFEGFGPLDLATLEKLAPKQVPSDLQKYTIFPIEAIAEQQKWSYHVFVIAEDASGKSAAAPPQVVTINTCYSGNFDFDVQPLVQFQAPLRLTPELVDQGREVVTAVFNVSYRGDASPGIAGEPAYTITGVEFERACTPGMMEDDSYKVGCTLLPQYPKKIPNGDLTAWYLTYNLRSGEKLSEKEDDFWDDFNKKRMVMFPLKVTVHYSERESDGTQTGGKTQVSCTDLSYFVDIPIDSSDMIPDFLADEGVRGINATINAINKVMPYLEMAIKVVGISCVSTFTLKMVVRYVRIVTSKIEAFASSVKGKEGKCPYNQNKQLMKDEAEEICGKKEGPYDEFCVEYKQNQKTLEDNCPTTANMWKTEKYLDQAYRWTCDRFFCRKVPAGWTEDKEVQDIESVILKQAQCTTSSRGVPLTLIENCNDFIQEGLDPTIYNVELVKKLKAEGAFPCYLNNVNSQYYYREPNQDESGKMELTWIAPRSLTLKQKVAPKLFAFWPEKADAPIVGEDKSCKSVCKSRPGYKADDEFGITNYHPPLKDGLKWENGSFGCYKEFINQEVSGVGKESTILKGKGDHPLPKGARSAGYTSDCFLNTDSEGTPIDPTDERETPLLQCVCVPSGKNATAPYGARLADKGEEWLYRQADIFRTTKGWGTDYPAERYYRGRDLSSAFGADSLLDYIGSEKTEATVNPHSGITDTFQTVCLPGIRARLVTLRSILQAVQGCIQDAKKNGLQDAGTCKTLFSQQVCGLLYKGIAYLASGCGPLSFQETTKGEGTLDGVAAVSSAVFGSIDEAMSSSIDEVTSDYTNGNLQEFFAGGAKGFAQSICMAAFGFDWPMGMDFIMDSAYAFPTATSVAVFLPEREFSTYNPSKGTAVYNYNLGVTLIPGCKIRSADVVLKCVGLDESNHPGVQCGSQGCDCLHTESNIPEAARTMSLEHGRMFDLRAGTVVDMGIPSPQKALNAEYRYDHVVVTLKLDRHEDAATCFDQGYEDGTFYFPLTDTSPPGEFVCQVDISSGRYLCPAVMAMFGGGAGAYFDEPDITCFDDDTESWTSCDTPNLFVKGDAIKIRGNMMTDGGKYCLRTRTTGSSSQPVDYTELLSDPAGPVRVTVPLGMVTEELVQGTGSTLTLVSGGGAGCSQPQAAMASSQLTQQSFTFIYDVVEGGYQIKVPPDSLHADSLSSGYSIVGGYLNYGNSNVLTPEQIKKARYNLGGLKAENLVGEPIAQVETSGQCVYQIGAAGGAAGGHVPGSRSIRVDLELLQPDASGNCMDANIPLKSSGSRKTKAFKNIQIQLESTASKVVSKLYLDFMAGQYPMVKDRALQILNEKKANLEDVEAIYYMVASYIMEDTVNWRVTQKSAICNYMEMFFNRRYVTIDQPASPYPPEVVSTAEFQKITKYLGEINGTAGCGISTSGAAASSGTAATTASTASPASTTSTAGCCADYTAYDDGTWKYKCLGGGKASSCRKSDCAIEKASFDIPAGHALQTACATT